MLIEPGFVDSKPEPSTFNNGKVCAKFTFKFRRGGRSCFTEVVAYEDLAKKVLGGLNKGDFIVVYGALNQYTTKKGESVHQIVASDIPIRIPASAVSPELQPEPVKAPEPPQKEEKPLPQTVSNDLLGAW